MDGVDYDRFGSYAVYECLGVGGMATVHRAAIDIGGGVIREVALKRLLPQLADDKHLVEDFVREAKLAAQLHHPNIVQILELGRSQGTYFIAMELVRGHSLLALMKLMRTANVRTPIPVIIALLVELLDALDYASNATDVDGAPLRIVHRDLTPSNLIVTDEGHLKIIDFGVAKAVSGKFMTNTGLVKGKLGYMAVEVLAGKPLDARADLFSVGVVAWELLAGKRLFKGTNEYDVISKIQRGVGRAPSTHNEACPPELDEIVMNALARDREHRWSAASAMRRALESVRRSYRGVTSDVMAWRNSLVPPPVEMPEPTMMLSETDLIPVKPAEAARTSAQSTAVERPRRASTPAASMEITAVRPEVEEPETDPDLTEITDDPFSQR